MVDFKKAIAAGMQSASDADRNNREINAVIEELNSQLAELTEGKVAVKTAFFAKDGMGIIANALSLPLTQLTGFEGIGASNTKINLAPQLLAKLERSASGYPMVVRFADQAFSVENQKHLSEVLLQLMMHPDTGKIIFKLQNMKPSLSNPPA